MDDVGFVVIVCFIIGWLLSVVLMRWDDKE